MPLLILSIAIIILLIVGLVLVGLNKIRNVPLIVLLFILNFVFANIYFLFCFLVALPHELYETLSCAEYFVQRLGQGGIWQWSCILYFVFIFVEFVLLVIRSVEPKSVQYEK